VPWLQFDLPLRAHARVENSGNVDFDANSALRVETVFGREVFRYDSTHVVFPGKPRVFSTGWDDASGIGLYRVSYRVTAAAEEQEAASYVLMVPRTLLWLVAALILAGGIYVARRKLR
jgi:hypothetical protein